MPPLLGTVSHNTKTITYFFLLAQKFYHILHYSILSWYECSVISCCWRKKKHKKQHSIIIDCVNRITAYILLFIYIFSCVTYVHVELRWLNTQLLNILIQQHNMQIITLNDLDICNGMTVFTLKCYERYRNLELIYRQMPVKERILSDTDWYRHWNAISRCCFAAFFFL